MRSRRSRPSWQIGLQALATLAMVVAGVLVPAALPVSAASATIYLGTDSQGDLTHNATDPHGGVWLTGTTDGTTSGPMDTGTNPASRGYGHLWETDVVSGICRVDTVDGSGAPLSPPMYARGGAFTGAPSNGGCITAGQKASQPSWDPRRNADGTFYVYTCDWAVASQGCFRLTYDPGSQTMKKSELLAPGRFPIGKHGIKPFSTALGGDGNLYVTSDILPYVYRISAPTTPNTGNQTVSVVATANSNSRIRATTLACWDPNRGGSTGLPTCASAAAAGNPAPDLVLTEKTKVTVLMDVASCAGLPVDVNNTGGPIGSPTCVPQNTNIRALTPMGAQTQGAWNRVVNANGLVGWGAAFDPNTIYISDSPGATSQILRYTINKDTQDSYSNFGVFVDGTLAQYAFGFSPTQSPDGRMFLGDDPSAGSTAFNGHIWTIAPNAAADALGAPGAPASPPPLPAAKVGAFYASGVSLPNDGVWIPGSLGGHLWIADGASGFCRIDNGALNPATCDITTPKPGQPAFDATNNVVYLPDQSTRGVGVVRVTFDPTTETVVPGSGVTVAPGQGLDGQKTAGAAIEPTSGTLYVGFLNRNTTAPTEIARVHNPNSASPTVDFVANTTRHKPVFTLAFMGSDLYVGDNGGLDLLANADACAPNGCATIQVLNTRGPRGMATDGTSIYLAGPSIPAGCPPTCPAPGSLNTPVQVYTPSTGDFSTFSSQALLADGTTLSQYDVVDSITVDPKGTVYIADDPNVLGLPAGTGRIFQIGSAAQEPLPAIVSKPTNPTNQNKPAFSFQSADTQASFKCSLVASSAPAAFQNCGGTGNGTITYGADANNAIVENGANPLADGSYVFSVQASSPAGTRSQIASDAFTISTTASGVSITAQPKSPGNVNAPSYSFQSATATPLTFQCSLTPAGTADALVPCTSPKAYPAQPDGTYTFKVVGTDSAGNAGTATTTTAIDTVAPTVSASVAGGQFTTAQSVVLTASEAATIYYTTDGTTPTSASPNSGASPLTVNVGSSLTLKYIAVDSAGNTSQPGSQTYQVGSVGITQNPPALTNNRSVNFAYTDTMAGATFQCSLQLASVADSFSPCGATQSYSNVADGAYRFVVQDNAGSQASFLFTVDGTPPTVSITNNPANPDTSSSATFGFTSNEAGTKFDCSFGLNTAPEAWSACTSPTTENNLADGTYLFKVRGTDPAGNTGQGPTYTLLVQAAGTAPSVTTPQVILAARTMAVPNSSATTSFGGTLAAASTTGVPVTVSWTGTACPSGALNCNVDHYVLQESIAGNPFIPVTLPSPTATSVTVSLRPSPTNDPKSATSYRFQVQAVDKTGTFSTFAPTPSFTVADTDNSFQSSFNGSWKGINLAQAFNGSVQASTTAGATAKPSNGLNASSFAVVSTMGPDRGKADILIDGGYVTTVDLYAPVQQAAQVVWSINGLSPATTHNVQIVSTNTRSQSSSGTQVDYDAVLAIQ